MKNVLQNEFEKRFHNIASKSIGIYGIGKNARTIIENVDGYLFSCLIAQDHWFETIDEVTILPLEEAIKQVDVIIIAAIPSSTAIVYNRIKSIVPENITIYDLQESLLRGKENYKKNPNWD